MDPKTNNQPTSNQPVVAPMTPDEIVQAQQLAADSTITQAVTSVSQGPRFSHKQKIMLIVGEVLLFTIAVTFSVLLSHNSITKWDVQAATNSATDLNSDVSSINASLKAVQSATTKAALTQATTALSSKVTDAQSQYNLLHTSPVLDDKNSNDQFTKLKSGWAGYIDFAQGMLNDYKTLGPLLIQLNGSQQSLLSTSHQSASSLTSELVQYQTLVATTGQQANTIKMQTVPDQQVLTAIQAYVKSTNTGIAQAESDASSNKGVNAITADIASITADATAESNAQDTQSAAITSTIQRLGPANELQTLISALNGLSSRI